MMWMMVMGICVGWRSSSDGGKLGRLAFFLSGSRDLDVGTEVGMSRLWRLGFDGSEGDLILYMACV